jgi:hypothetical protein
MKKIPFLFLVALIILISLPVSAEPTTADNEPADIIVASVDGSPIMLAQINEQTATMEMMYQNLGGNLSDEEIAEKTLKGKLEILNKLVEEQVIQNKLNSMGIEVTDEIRQKAEESCQATLKTVEEYVKTSYPDLTGTDLEETISMILSSQGLTKESILESAIQKSLLDELINTVKNEIKQVDETAVKTYYDSLYKEQKTAFDDNISNFEQVLLSGEPVVYRPVETRVIKQLYIKFDGDVISLINQLKSYGSDEEAKKMQDDQYIRMTAKVDDVISRLKSGTSFETIMDEFSEGSSGTVNYVSDLSTRFPEEFKKAAMSIAEMGDISATLKADYGYIILNWADTIKAADPVAFEDVRADLESFLLEDERNAAFENKKQEWIEEADIEIFADRLN